MIPVSGDATLGLNIGRVSFAPKRGSPTPLLATSHRASACRLFVQARRILLLYNHWQSLTMESGGSKSSNEPAVLYFDEDGDTRLSLTRCDPERTYVV